MQSYLPIAEVSVSVFLLLGLGTTVGILSGIFGVGGGFILTPLLFMIGIPPAVAVGTQGTLIVASSFSGMLAHLRRKSVDYRMGSVLLAGGLVGSAIGVQIFKVLERIGQVDLLVKLSYVLLLGVVGGLMLIEALAAFRRRNQAHHRRAARKHHSWVHGWPLKVKFRTSKLYISAIPPFGIGIMVGVLSAIMGVGGGFLMLPAMIYILGMPTKVVVGTSLFQITFMLSFTTVLHAVENQTVDIVLGFILLVGGVIGAQIGTRIGVKLKADTLRILLALLVLSISIKLAFDLVLTPSELFSLAN
ncbi:MAG: sulfite exporter TauE/SafE family protein [Alphaproteobacteria bacterium]|nr:sulfite exporter TauE/SafE family protein [Alphaproteobacteria bacterium]